MSKKELYEKVIAWFKENIPVAETELDYLTPWELLCAVILSAQCTDKRVNLITPGLFKRFPTVFDLASASESDVFECIKSCSFPNNKTKHLIGMSKSLVENYKGIVPDDVDEMQKLPGVGRKTANVIAAVVFNKPAMPVDTHVFRVAARIGLVENAKNPLQTEEQLVKYIPGELLPLAHHWLILHGRYVCKARKPLCNECGISDVCKYFKTV